MNERLSESEVARALKARMAAAALKHASRVDIRTGTLLEHAGLLKRDDESDISPHLLSMLSSADHALRIKTTGGPILLYKEAENRDQPFALDIRLLFFSTSPETRKAAWNYFMSPENSGCSCELARPTRATLSSVREQLCNPDPRIWQKAALQANDSIELDLPAHLAGLRQSISQQYEEGLRYHISKLLAPDPKCFDLLTKSMLQPSTHQNEILDSIKSLSNEEQLIPACEIFINELGILPFSLKLSFTEMLEKWIDCHSPQGNWRGDIREWVKSTNHPLARFYVSLALLEIESATEEVEEIDFINDLLNALFSESRTSENAKADKVYWDLSCALARHYLRHLETLSPGDSGEALAMAAWWLSSRLALTLIEFPEYFDHLNTVAIQPQINNTERAWRFSNPTIQSSAASIATHFAISPWRLSALNALSFAGARSRSIISRMEARNVFERDIAKNIAFGCATPKTDGAPDIYRFEVQFDEYLDRMQSIICDQESLALIQLTKDLHAASLNGDTFMKKFSNLSDCDDIEQFIIVNQTRNLSWQGKLPLDAVWSKLVDPHWRSKTFRKLSTTALEILFVAFAYSLNKGGGKWQAGLPHIYAQAAEDAINDDEKVKFLFALTMFSSIHTHSVSAIERLLRGQARSKFIEHGRWWKNILAQSSRTAPPWVSARIRALSAAITASQ